MRLDVTQATAPVRLAYAEARAYLRPEGDTTSSSLGLGDDPDGRADVVPAGTTRRWTSPGVRGAQRWVAISLDGPGTATIDGLAVRVTSLRPRWGSATGRFVSSDAALTRTWWAGAATLNLNTVPSGRGGPRKVVDGAKRDRLVWLGDLPLEALSAFATTPEAVRAVRASILTFNCQQRSDGYLPMASDVSSTCRQRGGPRIAPNPLTNVVKLGAYVPWWVMAVEQYWTHQGDARLARDLLPTARRALAWVEANAPNGLYEAGRTGLEINWHPFDVAAGEDAASQAVWYGGLRAMARMELALGRGRAVAARYLDRARRLRAVTIARLWDPVAGALRVNTRDPSRAHGQDAIAFGIAFGLLHGDRARRALRFLDTRLGSPFGTVMTERSDTPFMTRYVSPFIGSWELWARFRMRDAAGAARLLRREFAHMADADPGTLWEKMTPGGRPQPYNYFEAAALLRPPEVVTNPGLTSLAHGWSGGPTSALSAWVLGVQPTAPGYRRWRVSPQLAGLRWAQGLMPTPRGPIEVRWERRGTVLRLAVRGPRGTRGTIVLPGRSGAFRDGRRARLPAAVTGGRWTVLAVR